MKSRTFCIKLKKMSTRLARQMLRPGRAEQTGKAFRRFLGLVFLCLLRKQFHDLSLVFWQMHLVPCSLQELWIFYETKRFSQAALMLLRIINLYSVDSVYRFVCQKVKISRGTSVRARIFLSGFLHLFETSRDLCLTVARTNLRKYMCTVCIFWALEYGTIQKSSEKYI